MLAGLGMPALDLLYGLWTKDITPSGVTPDEIRSRSQFIAWIAAVVGVGELLFAWLFLACCE